MRTPGSVVARLAAELAPQRQQTVFALAALLCAALAAWLFLSASPLDLTIERSLGAVGEPRARGFYRGETTPDGRGFRWTRGAASLTLAARTAGHHVLELAISAPRPASDTTPLRLTIEGWAGMTTAQPNGIRHYRVLVPGSWPARPTTTVHIESTTMYAGETGWRRSLGVAVFDLGWRGLDAPGWLLPLQVAAIALAAGLFALALAAAGAPSWLRAPLLIMLVAILLSMRHSDASFTGRWNAVLMTAALIATLAASIALLSRPPAEAAPIFPARRWLREHWPAFAGFALVTGLMLAPLLARLSSAIVGPAGDNFEYVWKMSWFAEALLVRRTTPIGSPQVYFPSDTELTISDMTPAHTLLWLPLTALAGPVVAYNLAVVLSFFLTACFTYLLARRLGAGRGPAWVAGLIFAFCLERTSHLIDGHFGMVGSQWLALTLYGWEGVLSRRRRWDAVVAGVGAALLVWTSSHYAATFPFLLAIYTAIRLSLPELRALLRDWRLPAIVLAIAVPLTLPLAQPYVDAMLRGDSYSHPYAQVLSNSATPRDYLLPSPYHPIWGDSARRLYGREGAEFYVAVGLTATALALAGLLAARRRREAWALAAALALAAVMSLGPELRLPGGGVLALPAKYLYSRAPIWGEIRNWSRMGMYVALCAALLAGLGLAALPRRWQALGVTIAAALVLAESATAWPLSSTAPRPVDTWLREQPGQGAFVQIPRPAGGYSHYLTLLTGKPTSQGTGKYAPALQREERDTLYDFPDESSLRLAQRWGIEYFVVLEGPMDRDAPGWREALAAQPLVALAYRADGVSVYRVRQWEGRGL